MKNNTIENVTKDQSELVFKFMELLFSEDVEGYWDCISKVDQARVYGMYRVVAETDIYDDISFFDYVKHYFKPKQEEIYERVKEHPGLATHVRYTDEGEVLLYLLQDVQVPRVYIAETQEYVFPITLTIDTEVSNGEVNAKWKVRLYTDQNYKDLSSD
ncbi:hypothetical protein [Bacillus sp. 1NLA3E]|uniref:hypothetical protein n=1 Tax=Bacillus sp. 1NLA3E TaxID=666686 RepID=UPI000247E82D|nr:hypothetical protein [Bacillus sp. 1NLA3E]